MSKEDTLKKYKLKIRLSEAQNNRCCYCGHIIVYEPDHHNSATIERVDPNIPKQWDNLVAACYTCNNKRNGNNAYYYHNRIQAMGRPSKIIAQRDVDQNLQEHIRTLIKEQLEPLNIPYILTGLVPGAEKAYKDTEKFKYLIDALVTKNIEKYKYKSKKDYSSISSRRWRSVSKSIRIKLSEAQNHRCCYCGCSVQFDKPKKDDYATIEHVIEKSKGGSNTIDNFTIACPICNSHRSDSGFDAEDYYLYITEHGKHKRINKK